jgi:hypothetical protein
LNTPLALTPAEIADLTGLVQPAAQVKYLRSIGIKAERRRDGSVLVCRDWLAQPQTSGVASRPIIKSQRIRETAQV